MFALESLASYNDTLVKSGRCPAPGQTEANISFTLDLAMDGTPVAIKNITQNIINKNEKKPPTTLKMFLPAPTKTRTSDISPQFVWDNATYILGIPKNGNKEKALMSFESAKKLHTQILKDCQNPVAQAIVLFFQNWDPTTVAPDNPLIKDVWDNLQKGGNILITVCGINPIKEDDIREVWEEYFFDNMSESDGNGEKLYGTCLISGEQAEIARLHPKIKGIAGTNSTGGSLVSFNRQSFCHGGRWDKQCENAPITKRMAFAYTQALNYLTSHKYGVVCLSQKGTTVLFWPDDADETYQQYFEAAVFGYELPDEMTVADMLAALRAFSKGEPYKGLSLNPDMPFNILGLTGANGRIAIQFYYRNSFGHFSENIIAHYDRLNLGPTVRTLTPFFLFLAAGEDIKHINPRIEDGLYKAIIDNNPYPIDLLYKIDNRVEIEKNLSSDRVAFIKAYYCQQKENNLIKEVFAKMPDPNTVPGDISLKNDVAYTLGQLYAVFSALCDATKTGSKNTIDQYFGTVASCPASVFPNMFDKVNVYLKKLKSSKKGLYLFYEDNICTLIDHYQTLFPDEAAEFPKMFSLDDKNKFFVAYWLTKRWLYSKNHKKADTDDGSDVIDSSANNNYDKAEDPK